MSGNNEALRAVCYGFAMIVKALATRERGDRRVSLQALLYLLEEGVRHPNRVTYRQVNENILTG